MRWCVALVFFVGLNSVSQAQSLSPWFGSEASAPARVSFASKGQQIAASEEISTTDLAMICTTENCKSAARPVKQPK